MRFTKSEVYMEYTKKVNEYLQNGYYVYCATMKGTQGDVSKIDLTNGIEIIRIRLNNGITGLYKFNCSGGVFIKVEKYTQDMFNHNMFDIDTLWNDKGTELFYKEYYKLENKYKSNIFTDNIDEIKRIEKIREIRENRIKMYPDRAILTDKRKLLSIVKTKKGYKSTRLKDIIGLYRTYNGYIIKLFDGRMIKFYFKKDINK